MDIFFRAIMGSVVAVILYLILPKQAKEFSVILSVAVCVMIGIVAFSYLSPVISFAEKLSDIGKLDNDMTKTLFRAVGICLISEFASNLCTDSGNSAIAKVIQFLTSAFLISLSIPFLSRLIDLIQNLITEI